MASPLDLATVVMVRTTHPGNVGAAARAMGNMGLSRLALADPKCDHTSAEAVARASGLGRLLDAAAAHDGLDGAIADARHAFAFTARRRDLSQPVKDVRSAAADAAGMIASGDRIALVFGPEQAGLTNAETDVCDMIVEIPTEPGSHSLNVAAAVQVACHELRMAAAGPARQGEPAEAAGKGDVRALVEHLEQVLAASLPGEDGGMRRRMVRRLTMLLNRSSPDAADVRMLRGLLSAVRKAERRPPSGGN